jgi:hypothetical protein
MVNHHRYHRHHYKSQQMLAVLALALIGTSTRLTLTSAALVPLPSPVSTLSLSSLVSTKSRTNSNRDTGTVTSTRTSSTTTSSNLYMYQYPDYEYDPDQIRKPKPRPVLERTQTTATQKQTQKQTQTKTSTPTQIESEAEPQPTKPHNPKPKIIVLGATGKIGQHIIRNLMSCKQEMNIVAFVRDYDKACEVLYEDLIREQNTNSGLNKNKPTLTLMVMDLVPDSEVAGYEKRKKMARIQKNKNRKERRRRKVYKNYYEEEYELEEIDDDDDDDDEYDDDDDDDDNDSVNSKYAQSAAKFYKEDVSKYDYRRKTKDKYDIIDPYQPLYDAMKNATAVISTIGTVRETIPFVDYIVKPWRIFRTADKWCDDPTHPYYVNYMVMKKVLDCAEKEQIRRDNEWKAWEESQAEEDENEDAGVNNGKDIDTDSDTDENDIEIKTAIDIDMNKNIENNKNDKKDKKQGERIRIIRISDLCVANPPWDIVSVFTNIVRSLVFLSQEKCENLLQSSDIVDTIVLRPGDLVNERRVGSDGDSDSDHSFENEDEKEKDFHSENNISKDNVNMNVNEVNMSLEVDVNGYLPSPSYIGREDVAGLATLASISSLEPQFKRQQRNNKNSNNSAAQNITGIIQHEGRQRQNTNTRGMMRRRRNNKNNNDMKKGRKKAKHWNVAVGWTDKKVPVPTTATVTAVSSKNNNEQYLNSRKQHDSLQKAFQYIVKEEHKKSKVENRKVALQQDANPLTKLVLRPIQKRLRQFHIQQTKPYGIFVLLPMIFLVYPMICSIMFSIGKKIPGVELAAMKILSILKPMFLMWMQRMQLSSTGKAIMSRSRDPNQLKKLIY